MRVLVVTVVHHPEDARILHRQIRALLDAGHEVIYAAPFTDYGVCPPPEVTALDVPRAVGRRRLPAAWAARRLVRQQAPYADLLLLHDPELLAAVAGVRRPVTVWDVHEDTAAAVTLKPWLPRALRPATRLAVGALERLAERHFRLLLAEEGYRGRFRQPHPVVPNTTYVPSSVAPPGSTRGAGGRARVVYLGALSLPRGAAELVQAARLLAGDVEVELVGPADGQAGPLLEQAAAEGVLRWHGFVPNARALALLDGALAGLSLLHDEPNYRHSRPTKVIEYMAHGVPVVTTPLPPAAGLVEGVGAGLVVPFGDPGAVAAAVRRLRADPALRQAAGRRGHAAALARFSWPVHAAGFVSALERWAGQAPPQPAPLRLPSGVRREIRLPPAGPRARSPR